MPYAENTTVPVEKSKSEIERMIMRAGATRYATLSEPDRQSVAFTLNNLNLRFDVPVPAVREFKTGGGEKQKRTRTDKQMWDAWEKEVKRRWRALALCVKAKLEVIESGISTFEAEFLAHIVLKGGTTIGEEIVPKLSDVASGKAVKLLGGA